MDKDKEMKMEIDTCSSGSNSDNENRRMQPSLQKPLKACDAMRVKKGVVCGSYEEFLNTCCVKFEVEQIVSVVLEEDGTEIDEHYFKMVPNNTTLMFLGPGQSWQRTSTASPTPSDERMNPRMMSLLEKCRAANSRSGSVEKKAITGSRTKSVIVGWQHYTYSQNKFILMKSSGKHHNIGPRPIQMYKCLTKEQVLEEIKQVFFPNGKNFKGRLTNMDIFLGNYRGEEVEFQQLIDYGKDTGKPHLYLHTKEKLSSFELVDASSDSSENELPAPFSGFLSDLSAEQTRIVSASDSFISEPPRAETSTVSQVVNNPHFSLQQPVFQVSTPPLINSNNAYNPVNHSQAPMTQMSPLTQSSQQDKFVDLGTPTTSVSVDFLERSMVSVKNVLPANKCGICVDREVNAVFLPCGHTSCMVCATAVYEQRRSRCPVCRGDIEKINTLFLN